jgi:hypothetical protein
VRKGNRRTHSLGVNSASSDVKGELSLRNTHSSHSEVTKTENAGTVSDNADLHLVMRETGLEVGDDLGEVRLVVLAEVEGADGAVVLRGRRVDEGPVLASSTNDGAVGVGEVGGGLVTGRTKVAGRKGKMAVRVNDGLFRLREGGEEEERETEHVSHRRCSGRGRGRGKGKRNRRTVVSFKFEPMRE